MPKIETRIDELCLGQGPSRLGMTLFFCKTTEHAKLSDLQSANCSIFRYKRFQSYDFIWIGV